MSSATVVAQDNNLMKQMLCTPTFGKEINNFIDNGKGIFGEVWGGERLIRSAKWPCREGRSQRSSQMWIGGRGS